jgi:hypothetical protein
MNERPVFSIVIRFFISSQLYYKTDLHTTRLID